MPLPDSRSIIHRGPAATARSRPQALLWFTLSAASALAQSTTPKPASSPAPGEAVVLSPFTVVSDTDTGYAATETLAGTRMRTDLRDIGASLTILTPEFMRDLAVNSFDKALLYTPSVDSVEGDNTDANRQSGTQMRYGTGQSFSIRGFVSNAGNQSISHDFFTALDVPDNYNTERTTLSLGPNSLLIGVGSPQGTAITSTKRALLNRRRTEVQFQGDRWQSSRVSFDHNQPILKGQLALRINALHDQQREFRKYEGKNQDRVTLGIVAKPFANTTVTINHENYNLGINTSSLVWGFNSNALQWVARGRPTINFVPAGQTWTATRPYVDANGNPVRAAAGVTTSDGFVHQKADFDPFGVINQQGANQPRYVVGLNLANPLINYRYQGQLAAAAFGGITSSNYQGKDPWNLLGISRDTNLNGGTWTEPSQRHHGDWDTILVEQKLAESLHLELGRNVAHQHWILDPNNFTSVDIDPNRYLPDGSLNPGFGVPYNDNGGLQWRNYDNKATENRATLTYQIDFTKKSGWMRWLGSHGFSGLWQDTLTLNQQELLRFFNVATVGLPASGGWSGDATAGVNVLGSRVYFLNGNVPTMPDMNYLHRNLGTIQGYGRYLGATANEAQPVNFKKQGFLNPIKGKFTNETWSGGWQGKWLGNRLVTVLGVRQDDTKSYGSATVRDVALPDIAGSASDPLKRYFNTMYASPWNATPSIQAKGLSRTKGAVLHAFPWLSLTYSQSSNFLPVSNASWVDANGNSAPNSKGKTDDYGLRFSLLNGKLALSVNKFKTLADNQARNANATVGGTRAILGRLRDNYKTRGDSHFQDLSGPGGYPVDTGNVADTWSYVAEGYEMNLVFNPSRNWRMALSGSENVNQQGAHLLGIGQYLYTDTKFQGLGTWRGFAAELNKVAAGQPSNAFDLDPTSSTARAQAQADALYITQQADAQEKVWKDDQALTGIVTARNGKHGFNGLVTRVFTEGRLKGLSVGGNFRWRSAGTIGYQRLPDTLGRPRGVIDVSKPVSGEDFWDLGAMLAYERRVFNNIAWRIQLNVQNLPNWRDPRLVKSDYDTNGIYGTSDVIVPVLWEVRRPRNFILTSTFTF